MGEANSIIKLVEDLLFNIENGSLYYKEGGIEKDDEKQWKSNIKQCLNKVSDGISQWL